MSMNGRMKKDFPVREFLIRQINNDFKNIFTWNKTQLL